MFILTSAGSCLASVAAVCACQACQGITREVLRKSARLAYCALFTTAMVLAWVLRDFSKPLIEKIPCESQLVPAADLPAVLCLGEIYTKCCYRDRASGNWGHQ